VHGRRQLVPPMTPHTDLAGMRETFERVQFRLRRCRSVTT
jgi:hypothetical protein